MRVWLNGAMSDAGTSGISPFDHGFTVGDGVFETCKVIDGVPFALSRHLRRLARSARGLGLAAPDEAWLRAGITELLSAEPAAGRLRITYSGGPGPLGSERGDEGPTVVLAVSEAGSWPASTKVSLVPWVRNERSAVAGLKTTSYAENVVALAFAHERGASEAIFTNSRDELCEGTGSNLFVVLDGELVTPPLSSGCLAGVTRELVIEWSGAREAVVDRATFDGVQEAFLTSSTRDVQPIHAIDDRELVGVAGPVTALARKEFAARSGTTPDP